MPALNLAKLLFAVATLVMHIAWSMGVGYLWQSLPWWGFVVGLILYLPPATWILYLAGMALERAAEKDVNLPELAAFLEDLFKPIAAVHNIANNALPMSIVFLSPPRELFTTKRLNRHVAGGAWRGDLALFVRGQLLNFADHRGVHT